MHAACPAHIILFNLISLIIFDEVYKLRSSSLCSLLQPPTTSSWMQIFSSAPSSQIHSAFFPLCVRPSPGPSPVPCVTFHNMLVSSGEEESAPAHHPGFRTTPCKLSNNGLFSTFHATLHIWRHLLQLQVEDTPFCVDTDPFNVV